MGNIFSLEGKKIVAFGGSGYLGSASVKAMLDLGAQVVVADQFPEYTKGYAEELGAHPNCVLYECNADDTDSVRGAY